MKQPIVSIIVTTRNNHATLPACLASISSQTYPNIELIVVDRDSEDDTKDIARAYTSHVFNVGPERSTQRNFGVKKAKGDYIVIIDSDMELSPDVITSCVHLISNRPDTKGVIIPEESFGQGFWATCKKLERSFYVGVDWIEAARFFDKKSYQKVGGYDEKLVSGEDWDLSERIGHQGTIGRVDQFIYHNEGKPKFFNSLRKKYYYAGLAGKYLEKNSVDSKLMTQKGPLQRYKLFFSQPTKLFHNPLLGAGMLFMKTSEYAVGGVGYLMAKGKK
jgi:glycosyltransferase involved in cell wall biosynthesis